jgi:hypothetical protein
LFNSKTTEELKKRTLQHYISTNKNCPDIKNTCIENYISSTVLKFLLLGTTGERDSAVTAGSFYFRV